LPPLVADIGESGEMPAHMVSSSRISTSAEGKIVGSKLIILNTTGKGIPLVYTFKEKTGKPFDLVGGTQQLGETRDQTLLREVGEELRVSIRIQDVLYLGKSEDANAISAMYICSLQVFGTQRLSSLPHKWINLAAPDYGDCAEWLQARLDWAIKKAGSMQGLVALAAVTSPTPVEPMADDRMDTDIVREAKENIRVLWTTVARSLSPGKSAVEVAQETRVSAPTIDSVPVRIGGSNPQDAKVVAPVLDPPSIPSPSFISPSVSQRGLGVPSGYPPPRKTKPGYGSGELADDFNYFYLCAQAILASSRHGLSAAGLYDMLRHQNIPGDLPATRVDALVRRGWLTKTPLMGGHHQMGVYPGFHFTD